MRRCARTWAGSALLLAFVLARPTPSLADEDPGWALGAQVISTSTRFGDGIGATGPGVRGGILTRFAQNLWVGAEVAACAWVQPSVSYAAVVGQPAPLARRFQAGSAALVLHAGPQWRYRPYWVVALSVEQQTGSAMGTAEPQQTERAPGWAVGLGARGNRGAMPWLEWRWHQSFGSMAILGDRRLVYHTLGVGIGWN
jgi:hypothetical protein